MVNQNIIKENPLAHQQGIFYFRKIAAAFVLLLFTTGIYSQPKIEVKNPKESFGSVKRGAVIVKNYTITNVGNQPLLLEDAEVACSCTSVDFPSKPVLPMQTAVVEVTFKTATTYGRQDRVVILKSNDPKGDVKLRFKGTVSKE